MVVNLVDPPVRAIDLYRELAEARAQIAQLQQRIEELTDAPAPVEGISLGGQQLTTPAVFAELHHTSVSTVNRALNNEELKGVRQPNDRWLVVVDQPWTPKRRR